MKNKGKLIIITGPSGVGKGTVVKELIGNNKNFWLSISATTRQPRKGEIHGKEYYFFNRKEFKKKINEGLFLEWAEFAGNLYGTPAESVTERINNGKMVILEIEVEGAKQIREKYPDNLSIFLLPPSIEELERRIRNRGTDDENSILKRLKRAQHEIESSIDFDFAITNQNVDDSIRVILDLIKPSN
tara:strand:- start:2721 stop:3281 length:561 start_codon:yes stop_codon:yes gene_type:complete